MRYPNYEEDDTAFPAAAYAVAGYRGVAWYVYGWELESRLEEPWQDEESGEWYQSDEPEEVRTGKVVAVMVGDDRRFTFDLDELTPLEREEYCGVCGQVGCGHDGLDREVTNENDYRTGDNAGTA